MHTFCPVWLGFPSHSALD